ncbi:unnamed protein product, partial [Larinioides sclopetarius]
PLALLAHFQVVTIKSSPRSCFSEIEVHAPMMLFISSKVLK